MDRSVETDVIILDPGKNGTSRPGAMGYSASSLDSVVRSESCSRQRRA